MILPQLVIKLFLLLLLGIFASMFISEIGLFSLITLFLWQTVSPQTGNVTCRPCLNLLHHSKDNDSQKFL